MPALRTSLVALAVGGATLTTGLVATSASAAPARVAAVAAADGSTAPADGSTAPADGSHPLRAGIRQWWQDLTDEQRQCLEDADLRRPVGPLDDAERATVREQVRSAADGCGVELPFPRAREVRNHLTDEQRACLQGAGLTRPVGPLTGDERRSLREDVRAAADECGVTLPDGPRAGVRAGT